MIKVNKSKYIFSLILLIVISWGIFGCLNMVLAACPEGQISLQVSIPGIGECVGGFPEYVQSIYNLFIGVIGILSVIMIMAGGFQWLMAAGSAQKISGAKTTIISAAMGLVLALTSYTILSLINPELTVLKLDVPELGEVVFDRDNLVSETYCGNMAPAIQNQVINPEEYAGATGTYYYYECGTTYQVGDTGQFCIGTTCDVFNAGTSRCVKTSSYHEYSCLSEMEFGGLKSLGYPEDYYTDEWEFYITRPNEGYTCGQVVYEYSNWIDDEGVVSLYCGDIGTHCLLFMYPGLLGTSGEAPVNYQSIVNKDDPYLIGILDKSMCVSNSNINRATE